MTRRSAVMTTSRVRLSFALPSFEDTFCAAMAHNTIYDGLHIMADEKHSICFACELPDDAHKGDTILLNATKITARRSQYFVEYTLEQKDIESRMVELNFKYITGSDHCVLQLMLYGLNATLKDNIEFDAYIKAFGLGYQQPKQQPLVTNEPHSFKQFATSFSSFFISLF